MEKPEEGGSDMEDKEIEELEQIEATSNKTPSHETPEESRAKIKTNLEILLSQNDILPLLKKIRKEKSKFRGSVSLSKYMVKNDKVRNYLIFIKILILLEECQFSILEWKECSNDEQKCG